MGPEPCFFLGWQQCISKILFWNFPFSNDLFFFKLAIDSELCSYHFVVRLQVPGLEHGHQLGYWSHAGDTGGAQTQRPLTNSQALSAAVDAPRHQRASRNVLRLEEKPPLLQRCRGVVHPAAHWDTPALCCETTMVTENTWRLKWLHRSHGSADSIHLLLFEFWHAEQTGVSSVGGGCSSSPWVAGPASHRLGSVVLQQISESCFQVLQLVGSPIHTVEQLFLDARTHAHKTTTHATTI